MESKNICNNFESVMDWTRIMKIFGMFSAIDLSIQSQFLQGWTETFLRGQESRENQDNSTWNTSHQTAQISFITESHFFYSAVFRFLFVTYFCHISYERSIPKKIQPFMGYILSAILYLICVHAVTVFLINSEHPDKFTATHIISWLLNLCSIIISGIFVYHVLYNSGAIEKNDRKAKDDEEEDTEKKTYFELWSGERKIPFFTMLKRIFAWYKPQSRWILLSYILLAVNMCSKFRTFKTTHILEE